MVITSLSRRILPLLGLLPALAFAQQAVPPDLEDVPEPPPLPEPVKSGEVLEPEVTIVRRERSTVYEYRVNGQLRAIKVVPDRGRPYFLVDADGDGRLETTRSALAPDFLVPAWVLFSW